MASELYLVSGSILIIVGILLVEETLNLVLRRAAKLANVRPSVIRDTSIGLRIVAFLIIASAVLSFTGLSSEFTSLTISGIAALAASLALQSTLSNIIAGILLVQDGTIRVGDQIEYGGLKGKVARIAPRNTWLTLDSGSIAVVSNSSLSSGPLVNHTATERLSKKYGLR